MGWFRKTRALRPVTTGRNWPDPILDAALAEAGDGKLGAARTVLVECREQPEIRAFRVAELARALVGFGGEITTIAGPSDPDLLLLSGVVFGREAWAIRGAGMAATVGGQRFDVFHSHLAQAVTPLRAAADLLPEDPVVWAEMEPVSRGLGFEQAEQDELWAQVVRRCPTLTTAVKRRLQALAPKWGGTEDGMLAFARETAAAAPAGHPVTAVLADAMLEGAAATGSAVSDYARPEHANLVAASRKFRTETRRIPETVWAHNAFAAVFSMLGDAEHAAAHLRAMGDHLCAPWDFIGGEAAYHAAAAKYL